MGAYSRRMAYLQNDFSSGGLFGDWGRIQGFPVYD